MTKYFQQTQKEDTIECINNCNDVKLSSLSLPTSNSEFIDTVMTHYGSSPHYFSDNDTSGFTLTHKDPNQHCEYIKIISV